VIRIVRHTNILKHQIKGIRDMVKAKKKAETKPILKPWHFKPGNQFWKFRTKHGANKIFSDPVLLWKECVKYFKWCEDHPLLEEKVFHAAGDITRTNVTKLRAMTIQGLCFYLRISDETWANYKKDKDLFGIIREAEQVIYDQKFTGAAADLLNPTIIARELGLAEKKDIKVSVHEEDLEDLV